MTLDPQTLRKDFPTLQRDVRGKRLVFLDSAASSQTPRSVIDAMDRFYERSRSNVHRGVYLLAEEATDLYESGRTAVARFTNTPTEGVVFTKNATEAINLVAYSWVRERLGPGDTLLTTQMEHHANLVPWLTASHARGFEVRTIPLTGDGRLDVDAVEGLVADGSVRFLALTQASNVLGTIVDVNDVVARVRAASPDVVVLVDACQSVPHRPMDFAALDADFAAFSGHKMLGPTGIGVLLGRPERLDAMPPFLAGGEMIREVTFEDATFNDLPYKFEAGTPMIAEAAGLAAAVEYLEGLGMDAVRAHEQELTGHLIDALDAVDGVTILGPRDTALRGGAVSFTLDGVHPHDVGAMLDQHGVCVRVGHHCAKPLMKVLDVNATVRASVYVYNDVDDLQPLVDGLEAAARFFAR
ncbi:MAG: SufS family cysteine desulfurase [Actinomycetes bacterium]